MTSIYIGLGLLIERHKSKTYKLFIINTSLRILIQVRRHNRHKDPERLIGV